MFYCPFMFNRKKFEKEMTELFLNLFRVFVNSPKHIRAGRTITCGNNMAVTSLDHAMRKGQLCCGEVNVLWM